MKGIKNVRIYCGFCVEEVISKQALLLEWRWNNKNNKNLSFFQIPYNHHT